MTPYVATAAGLPAVLDFIAGIVWPFILLVFLIVCRAAISNVFFRLTNLRLRWGKAAGEITAAPPQADPKNAPENMAVEINRETTEEPRIEPIANEVWFYKMHSAFLENRLEEAKQIFRGYCHRERDRKKRTANQAIFLYLLYQEGGDRSAITRMESLIRETPEEKLKQEIQTLLSACYTGAKDFKKAESLWLGAIESVRDRNIKAENLEYLVNILMRQKKYKEAADMVKKHLKSAETDQERIIFFGTFPDWKRRRGTCLWLPCAWRKLCNSAPTTRTCCSMRRTCKVKQA